MTKTRFKAWAVFCLVAGLSLNCAADEENGIYLSTDRPAVYRKPAVLVPDKEGSLGLQQTSPAPVDQPTWPFVTGLPMPQGMVTDVSKVQLVGQNGDSIPAQFEALAHWSPKRQSVNGDVVVKYGKNGAKAFRWPDNVMTHLDNLIPLGWRAVWFCFS